MYTSSSFFLENVTCYFGLCFFCEAPFSRERNFLFFFHMFAKKLAPKKFLCFATKKKFYFCSLLLFLFCCASFF